MSLRDLLIENPVIAAVRSPDELDRALRSRVQIVFVLSGSVLTLPETCARLRASGKTVFVHVDMIEGLRGDLAGVEFIRRFAEPSGILTTHVNIVRHAKQLRLETILRIFLLDSQSVKTGLRSVNEVEPDAVEVMPGIACRFFCAVNHQVGVPVIAGGLIENREQVLETLSAGAVAISTSREELWEL